MRKATFLFFFLTIILYSSNNILAQNQPVFIGDSTVWADSILEGLSNEQRIAQLFMVAAYSNKGEKHKQEIRELIEKYNIGGLMFLQGGPVRQAKLTNYFQERSEVPLMIALDAEWGVAMRLDSALSFPWNMTLGAIQDSTLIYRMGEEVARQCKLLGIHINFAPVIDVNSNPKNPIINNRSFGEDPNRVANLGVAFMNGMQDNNVLACAKHFPGHGDTDSDSHKTLPIVNHSKERLNSIELLPFRRLIDNRLGAVMIAHLYIPTLDSTEDLATSLSSKVVNGLLKDELGFRGLSITDALNMKGVSDFYEPGLLDVRALLAGNDVLLFSEDVPQAIKEIENALLNNMITQEEINHRCRKILIAKQWLGLDNYTPVNISEISNKIITSDTRLLEKKLVKSSLTLLQNYEDLLPLQRLDTLKIASVSIGTGFSAFQEMLSNYAPITHFSIAENASVSEQAILLNKLLKYNLVIASVHKSNRTAWESYSIQRDIDVFLQSIALQNKVIIPIFANPYSLNSFLFTNNFDAMLLSYQNSQVAQEQTAQAIFGGVGLNGKIPVSTKHFDFNRGLNASPIRMSYVMPEEINVDKNIEYKIDSIVRNAIANKATPGCQILIAKSGKIFFNKSYGYHTYLKNRIVRNSDVYDLASITKIAASLPLLMQMVDDDSFDLYDRLSDYLDIDTTNKANLVVGEILAHQANLKPWIPFYKNTLVQDSVSGLMRLRDTLYSDVQSDKFPFKVADNIYLHFSYPDSVLKQIYQSELLINKEYRYSDLGYYLFKEIIEKNYGESLDRVVMSEFYRGLGMENLGYLPLNRIDSDRVIPTEEDFEFRSQLLKGYVHDMGAALQGGIGGHAGLFSNANDLAKLMQMYLEEGQYAGERYLSKEVINNFTERQYSDNNNRRGVGFDKPALDDQDGGPTCEGISALSFGHTGFTGTLAWADPSTELIYIFLSNRIHPDASNMKLLDMNVRTDIMEVIFNSFNEE